MQIYSKVNEKCYFSVISWPILILFVLSDRAWCGLQNFYTEFWNPLIMQIYANLFKINEKCYFVISWPILILFVLSDRAWCGLQNFYTEFWIYINYANLCKFIQNQWKMHFRSALLAGTYITHRVIYYPLIWNADVRHNPFMHLTVILAIPRILYVAHVQNLNNLGFNQISTKISMVVY